jgi:hypothetical protein
MRGSSFSCCQAFSVYAPYPQLCFVFVIPIDYFILSNPDIFPQNTCILGLVSIFSACVERIFRLPRTEATRAFFRYDAVTFLFYFRSTGQSPTWCGYIFNMPSLLQALLFLALVSLVLAAPYPGQIQKRSFKVERIPNPHFKRAEGHKRAAGAGTRALIKTYRKYGRPLPAALAAITANAGAGSTTGSAASEIESEISQLLGGADKAGKGKGHGHKSAASQAVSAATASASTGAAPSSTATTGTAAASNTTAGAGLVVNNPTSGDTEYLAAITVGGQSMVMDFDSGSSDLWVFNTGMPSDQQTGHTVFDPSKSSTFQTLTGSTFSISYGDGSGAAGTVGTDDVSIGGATVTGQAVELATAVSQTFVTDTASNGLVGLAFSKLNTVQPAQQKTFFENAVSTLPEPVFTADLQHAAPGAYEFGAIDSTKFTGELSWAAINTTSGFWQFSSQSFSVSTGSGTTSVPGGQAIADTGTTLMLADQSVVDAYYSQVDGATEDASAGGVTFPCSATLPDLSVDIGGSFQATVLGSDINFAPVDATATTCFGGLQAITEQPQIYGDIMFKSQFVVFNLGNNSIAMAPHA